MIVFEDPFERLLQVAVTEFAVEAVVAFVDPCELPRTRWWRRAKGVTMWPNDPDDIPIILIDGTLRKGVGGTLDILAHELAHVFAGPEDDHGRMWKKAYARLYEAACEQAHVERYIKTQTDSQELRDHLVSLVREIIAVDSGTPPDTVSLPDTAVGHAAVDFLNALREQHKPGEPS
jgi:hypothetical protein